MKQASYPRPSKSIDTHLLVTLVILLDTVHVGRTADILGVTQPAISYALRRLRLYFEDPLIIRTGRDYQLTSRALELKEVLPNLIHTIETTLHPRRFDPAIAKETFAICLSDISAFIHLADLIDNIHSEAPDCAIECLHITAEDIADALMRGEITLAIGGLLPEMPASLRQRMLFSYDYVCISRRGLFTTPLTEKIYRQQSHVVVSRNGRPHDQLDVSLASNKINRKIIVSLAHNIAAGHLVTKSNLICSLPRPAAMQLLELFELDLHELPIESPMIRSRMYWHERVQLDPAHQWLRKMIIRTMGRKDNDWPDR